MTMGIGAYGSRAGLAIVKALRAVELVSWGSIGGFVSYAVITAQGEVIRRQIQQGGTKNLFGRSCGLDAIPEEIKEARYAALISSGPNRPEPLSKFVAAHADVGLVTGHRFPDTVDKNGIALNEKVLNLMKTGVSAQEAVDKVMRENPSADAGLVAVDIAGNIGIANSKRVDERFDQAKKMNRTKNSAAAVLFNSIYPVDTLGGLVTDIASQTMKEKISVKDFITVKRGTPVEIGASNSVIVNDAKQVLRVFTTDATILTGKHDCAALYLDAEVLQGEKKIGHILIEPYTVVEDGLIKTINGQNEFSVGFV